MTTHSPTINLPAMSYSSLKLPGNFLKARAGKAGFNLVEVVLAMCVIAIAFTSLFGVLPVAMQNYRHSINYTVQSNILAEVSSEFQQTSSDQIEAMVSSNKVTPAQIYFSDEGQEVAEATQASYAVTLAFPSSSAGVDTTIFGAGGNGPEGNPNTALIPITLSIYAMHSGIAETNPLLTTMIFISSPDDPKAPNAAPTS